MHAFATVGHGPLTGRPLQPCNLVPAEETITAVRDYDQRYDSEPNQSLYIEYTNMEIIVHKAICLLVFIVSSDRCLNTRTYSVP